MKRRAFISGNALCSETLASRRVIKNQRYVKVI